ncbi:MAG: leucyl/phenylalanyl-tRNA--protein transferase [Gemmatales bacterium]|nr:leucyl/phenylalanyl-tRNA--protein transferase [Gemmatales bacterium]MDW7994452.1 leucyl/phenylalanyl-tRNA--protein transferase [Gemmatales bacterium]
MPFWLRGIPVLTSTTDDEWFPDPSRADSEGLVCLGGRPSPRRLLAAYRRGIFPWYSEGEPVAWYSPDPRAIFDLNNFHVPRRLARTVRQGKFDLTINRAFYDVVQGCAARGLEGTWITSDLFDTYVQLHQQGYAHSVEAWYHGQLAGGIFGIAIGGFFSGDSMFYRVRDASKVALVYLVEYLRRRGYVLFDIQVINEHTARFGAILIPRSDYLRRLQHALQLSVTFIDNSLSANHMSL